MPSNNSDVLIVGAGPVGLTLANLLCAEGIATLLLEEFGVARVLVRVAKPGAVRAAKTVAVEIVREAK